VLSNGTHMLTGAAFGAGVYTAREAGASWSYAAARGSELRVIARCELDAGVAAESTPAGAPDYCVVRDAAALRMTHLLVRGLPQQPEGLRDGCAGGGPPPE
jgi:hypothetical protein